MPPPMLSSRQRRFLTWPLLPPKTHKTKTFENRHLTPDTAREPARCEVSKALDRTVLGKDGLSLFQMRSEALLCLGTREPKHLERCGGVKDWAVHAKPIVKRVFGPTDCALRAVGQAFGCLKRSLLQIHIVHTKLNTLPWPNHTAGAK